MNMMARAENKPVAVVSVRLVSADYYMSNPIPGLDIGYSTYRGLEVKKVPVIRVFGSTSTGHKVCLHVHGVFPYLYIPYDGSAPPEQMGHQIVMALDKAINILQGQGNSSFHHVFKAVLVSGIPIYGFHAKEHQLFKVYFYNPNTRKHSYDLLLNGAVLKKILQPCEAHIPFILQFLMDFNLQGMNFIHLKKAFARRNPGDNVDNFYPSKAEPVSTCEMELDCFASDILNSLDVQDGIQMNPGLAALWDEEIERRKVKNINLDTINPPASQPRSQAVPTSSHIFYKANLSKQLREYASETGDVSLSFCEVNEQQETSLAIETPEGVEGTLLSASSIDFHSSLETKGQHPVEGDADLLDILCDLADEHESFVCTPSESSSSLEDTAVKSQNSRTLRLTVTTPVLEFVSSGDSVEDLPYDDDSVLGTQHSGTTSDNIAQIGISDPKSDSDEERETMEMSQIFEESEHSVDMFTNGHENNNRFASASTSLAQITERDEIIEESSNSSFDEYCLPNVDGADDSSSEDERQDLAGKRRVKKEKKYRPLMFRSTSNATISEVSHDTYTAIKLRYPSSSPPRFPSAYSTSLATTPGANFPVVDETCLEDSHICSLPSSELTIKSNKSEYTDALYTMSYLSPPPFQPSESPPRPLTPIKDARVTIRPLLQDISAFEATKGCKVKMNSGLVVLKSLEEEILAYQKRTLRNLRISSHVPRQESLFKPNPRKRKRKGKPSAEKEIRNNISGESQVKEESQHIDTSVDDLTKSEKVKLTCELRQKESFIAIGSESIEGKVLETKSEETKQTTNVDICGFVAEEIAKENENSSEVSSNEKESTTLVKEPEDYTSDPGINSLSSIVTDTNQRSRMLPLSNMENSGEEALSDVELNASRSRTPNLSQSSSSHLLVRSRNSSSNFSWNEDSSLLLQDIADADKTEAEQPSLADSSLKIYPQIFHSSKIYVTAVDSPSRERVVSTLNLYDIPSKDNGKPYWSDANDFLSTSKTKDIRQQSVTIGTHLVCHLPDFGKRLCQIDEISSNDAYVPIVLTPLSKPPSRQTVIKWLEEKQIQESSNVGKQSVIKTEALNKAARKAKAGDRSQLEAPSLNNSFGFRVSFGNCHEAKAVHQNQYLTILSVELHIETRQSLRPDPEFDAVIALFYTVTNDVPLHSPTPDMVTGVIVIDPEKTPESNQKSKFFRRSGIVNVEFLSVGSEAALFEQLRELVSFWDPDIVVGYEIEMLSWGYLLQRGKFLGINVQNQLSRIPGAFPERPTGVLEDIIEGGYMVEKNSDITIGGRIVLNLWRILRVEVALQSYTFENMVFHILHRRVSTFPFEKLTVWWHSNHDRWQVVEHYISRVRGNIDLMEQLDVIGRTSELARLFGIQFYEVFTRGSQYRVESMMLRLAKPKNFIAVSPSVQQRARMKAPEWLPLILEPESKFYTDPVLVLDFQSLYPSMIIAYNYCYSTCLGRAQLLGKNEPFEFGCTQLLVPPATVRKLVKQDLVNISPAGVVFVKPEVRTGIIPQMLSEILNTRIMVKQSMKEYEGDTTLRRVFDSRQLGLKLIANVTYGYTSANFSGRMPCVELGDSVVSKGRETLERAIRLIEERKEWKARVVYGDTDSVFVLLSGRSREEAFKIGDEIAHAVTKANPQPVKLKFEKVYQPCILQTKKRYVGYKYESVNQKEPVYEAKGIETVRRDGCPAVVKLLERSLRLLFESCDVSKVKVYLQRQFMKILQNRNSLQDFIFAKEFRGREGYKPGACVPALEIAKQKVRIDRRSEPRIGERVPYIIVYGSPGVPLIRLVVPANQLLVDTSLRLNAHYYISRAIIPALQRCLGIKTFHGWVLRHRP
ncbi:DNA polymerase zeta catalytic subunit-like isoform X2 [Daphnia carinata]|uniref:DNA polymerase zeta catalytic subunit-like isoform X2 n=1 Tax=Daphnia carinata TaxID=120202 RepID=UPI00286869D6|nr:DNA polymerase zeta catalytic subunit-like isoform X2 [Daphnia carinata]